MQQLKIGIIHIQSGIYPLASYDFADGIVEGLLKEGIEAQVFAQEAENGTNHKLISEKALKLLRMDKVDAIFTLAENHQIVEALENMAVWTKKPFFIISLGARLGTPSTPSNFIYFHELDGWKSAWAAGNEIQQSYSPVTFMSCLYEAGYQFGYAFSRALTDKGKISPAIGVIKKPMEMQEVQEMLTKIAEGTPQAIYLAMSYKEGANVLSAYAESQWAETPLYLSPFVLNEYVNVADVAKIPHLYEVSAIDYNKMQSQPLETVQTNDFSLLGFEAGRILGQKHKNGTAQDIVIESPRGEVTLPANSFRTSSNQYLYKIGVENGEIKRTLVKTISDLPSVNDFLAGQENLVFSQWMNPYMFA
jgi:hypothetical protein